MRVSAILGLALVLATSMAFAQQKPQTYRGKKSDKVEEKRAPRATAVVKTPNATTEASRDLHRIEQQSLRNSGGARQSSQKATTGSASTFRPEKPRPTPPITANAGSGMGTNTKTGPANQLKNPYKGRLRQKSNH